MYNARMRVGGIRSLSRNLRGFLVLRGPALPTLFISSPVRLSFFSLSLEAIGK